MESVKSIFADVDFLGSTTKNYKFVENISFIELHKDLFVKEFSWPIPDSNSSRERETTNDSNIIFGILLYNTINSKVVNSLLSYKCFLVKTPLEKVFFYILSKQC